MVVAVRPISFLVRLLWTSDAKPHVEAMKKGNKLGQCFHSRSRPVSLPCAGRLLSVVEQEDMPRSGVDFQDPCRTRCEAIVSQYALCLTAAIHASLTYSVGRTRPAIRRCNMSCAILRRMPTPTAETRGVYTLCPLHLGTVVGAEMASSRQSVQGIFYCLLGCELRGEVDTVLTAIAASIHIFNSREGFKQQRQHPHYLFHSPKAYRIAVAMAQNQVSLFSLRCILPGTHFGLGNSWFLELRGSTTGSPGNHCPPAGLRQQPAIPTCASNSLH